MSNHTSGIVLTVLLTAAISIPSIVNSKERRQRGANRYADDSIAVPLADRVQTQYFLGAADIIGSTLFFKSAFSTPSALKLKQEMITNAADLELRKLELVESKKLITAEEATTKTNKVSQRLKGLSSQQLNPADFDEIKTNYIQTELKMSPEEFSDLKQKMRTSTLITQSEKSSLIKKITNQIDSLQSVKHSQQLGFGKFLNSKGLKVRAIHFAGGAFLAVDLLNRVIVWELLNDFPGYIIDFGDIKNIAFNLLGIGDWEIIKDDGSRSREL